MNITLPWQKNNHGNNSSDRRAKAESRESVESELKLSERSAAERRKAEELAREVRSNPKARRLTSLMQERFEAACARRRSWEAEAILSCAMYEGRQWLRWDDRVHQAISLMAEKEKARYVTHNLIAPLADKIVALATTTKPDATPAPQTTAPIDRQAAEEARAIVADRARAYGGYVQTRKVAFWAAKTGCGYLKHCWLPKRKVPVPIYKDGQLVGREVAPLGLEEQRVISPFEVFIDADALTWEDAGFVFHACMMPLSWYEEKFGAIGKAVEPTARGQLGIGVGQAYLSTSFGSVGQLDSYCHTQGGPGRMAFCLEMWEKPTPTYPEGRYAVLGNDLLLTDPEQKLPYNQLIEGEKTIPFSRLVYREAQNHGYGRGLVSDLCVPQMEMNRLLTKAVTSAEDAKTVVFRSKRDGAGNDLMEMLEAGRSEFRNRLEFIYNFGSEPPMMHPMPDIFGALAPVIDLTWLHMQHIAGVHDVNMGGAPAGMTAGIAIALAQEGDRTQNSHFTGNIEHYAYQRDTTSIALHAQFLDGYFPRLMALDESGNPDNAQAQAHAFTALTNGGAVEVVVVPGSATPRTAAGKKQEILDLVGAGLLDPNNPQAEMAIQLLSLPETSQVLEHFERLKAAKAGVGGRGSGIGESGGPGGLGGPGGPGDGGPGGLGPLGAMGLPGMGDPGMMGPPGAMGPMGPGAMGPPGMMGPPGPMGPEMMGMPPGPTGPPGSLSHPPPPSLASERGGGPMGLPEAMVPPGADLPPELLGMDGQLGPPPGMADGPPELPGGDADRAGLVARALKTIARLRGRIGRARGNGG